MTTVSCLACLYPDSKELHTCGRAVAFPAEAKTLGTGTHPIVPERKVEHFFGLPVDGKPSIEERYCTEPLIPGSKVTRVYHANYKMLPDDNLQCLHCGTLFLEPL